MDQVRYLCPCCGLLTLVGRGPGSYGLCPVCFWEDDPWQSENPLMDGGANNECLVQARENYHRFGASSREFVALVRGALQEEISRDRFIVVGDIHGCSAQLEEILRLRGEYPHHRWVFLGDYLDRGPDAEGVIHQLRNLEAIFLLGNHEETFLTPWRVHQRPSDRAALAQTVGISEASAQWLDSTLVESFETAEYLFVHAGLDQEKPLDQQTTADLLWTRYRGDYSHLTPKLLIHGHTPVVRPEQVGNRLNINTGCGSGGPLTALILPEGEFVQAQRGGVSEASPFGNSLSQKHLD